MDPNLLRLARLLHEERLQEVAQARYFREVGMPGPSLQKRVLLSLSNFLIASGQKLKRWYQTEATEPILHVG